MSDMRSAENPSAGWLRKSGTATSWSGSVFRLLGLSPDAFSPSLDLLASFLHPDDVHLRACLDEMLEGRASGPVGARLIRRDGSVLQVAFAPSDRREGGGGHEVCLLDLTPLVGLPGDVDDARDLLPLVLSEMADGVLLLGPDGSILRGNAAAYRLLGLDPERGSALWLQYPGLVSDPIWQFFQRGAAGAARRLAGERWVPAFGRWLGYSLTRLGDRTLLVFRDREDVFRLRSSLDQASECWSAAVASAEAVVVDSIVDKGGPRCAWDEGVSLPNGVALCGDIFPDLREGELARLSAAIEGALAGSGAVELDLELVSSRRMRLRATARIEGRSGRIRLRGLALPLGPAGEGAGPGATARPLALHAVTGAQVRAARGALRWSVRELAEASHVSVATINRFETSAPGAGHARDSNVAALARTLADRGISFFRSGDFPAIGILDVDPGSRTEMFFGPVTSLRVVDQVA